MNLRQREHYDQATELSLVVNTSEINQKHYTIQIISMNKMKYQFSKFMMDFFSNRQPLSQKIFLLLKTNQKNYRIFYSAPFTYTGFKYGKLLSLLMTECYRAIGDMRQLFMSIHVMAYRWWVSVIKGLNQHIVEKESETTQNMLNGQLELLANTKL